MAIIDKPSDYFTPHIWSGTSSNHTESIGMQPDFVWVKGRSVATDHTLFDVVRGFTVGKSLNSNTTAAEDGSNTTAYGGIGGVTSDGFTVTAGSSNADYVNTSGRTYASWNWKAGTTGSGTTTGAGTGKAYSYSVNTTSGFSIVTYLGNGTEDHTIPHHLGVAPKMYIVKQRDGADSWITYHDGLGGADKYILLNTTAVVGTSNNPWGTVVPTSSVNNLGSAGDTNGNDDSFIMYSFADVQGYSKFGSYTGNGNADGPFVYTGFKPAFVITKGSANISSWSMTDSTISTFNDGSLEFFKANEADGESSRSNYDILSNGFKMRTTDADYNGSGINYIYMAFAENPFVATSGTNAIPVTAR